MTFLIDGALIQRVWSRVSKLLAVPLCLGLLALISPSANADSCSSSIAMPYMQTLAQMMVPSNLPVGSTIPNSTYSFTLSGACTPKGTYIYSGAPVVSCYYGTGTEVMSGVYSTGLAGVGIRLRNSKGQPMVNASGQYCDTRSAGLGTLDANLKYSFTVTVEFVKTGTITGGAVASAQTWFGFGVYNGPGLGGAGKNYIGFNGNVVVQNLTCTVTNPTNVSLASVKLRDIPNIGDTANPTPFALGLRCDNTVVVGVTFDATGGTPIKSAANGVFGSQNEGSSGVATGVGVQLISAGTNTPVPLQQRIALGSLAANTQATYPYQFRYYRHSATGTPGKVNGTMVLTFDYQ